MTLEEYIEQHPELGEPWTTVHSTGQGQYRRREQGFRDGLLVERFSPLTGQQEVWRVPDRPFDPTL